MCYTSASWCRDTFGVARCFAELHIRIELSKELFDLIIIIIIIIIINIQHTNIRSSIVQVSY